MRDADFNRYALLADKLNAIESVPCQEDAAVFYPEDYFDDENRSIAIAEAKSLCQGCAALDLCADYATKANEVYGIWGGLTRKERKASLGKP